MIHYLRIPKNKFWGWVFSSLAVGLLIGAVGAYAVSRTYSYKQVDELKRALSAQVSQTTSSTASLQAQLDSAETSLAALNDKYTALQEEQTKAKAQSASSSSSTASQTVTLEVQQRSIRPSVVATGDDITLSARVQGHPDKVTMRIYNNANGYDETITLKRVSRGATTETWRRVIAAPKKTGTYRYYATAYLGDKSATQPGASPSSFKVE
jgi:hypothetical protein